MKKSRLLFLAIFTSLWVVTMLIKFAAAETADSSSAIDGDGKNEDKTSFMGMPFVFYSPETRFGAGVMSNYVKNGELEISKPSSLLGVLMYTQENQVISALKSEYYSADNNYHLTANLSYLKFPTKYWGIGTNTINDAEEEYTPEQAALDLGLKYQFIPRVYAGVTYYYEHLAMIETADDGQLANDDIIGSNGGSVSMIGGIISFDSRDNIFWPTRGQLHQITYGVSDEGLGSDYNYNRLTADFRNYFSLAENQVLATQVYFDRVNGDPPFHLLPGLGGDIIMRGYYLSRYIDKNMYAVQAEYRRPLWWKLGMAAFAGLGDVAARIDEFQAKEIKYTFGMGLRYMINEADKLNVRFDYGIGENTTGFYISFAEAF